VEDNDVRGSGWDGFFVGVFLLGVKIWWVSYVLILSLKDA